MKRFFIMLLVALSALAITVSEAEAKRLGGGGSFGRQSQGISRQAPAQSNQMSNANQARPAPSASPQSIPPKPASPWRNILGGALLGLGLGALFSHFGFGGAMGGMLGSLLMIVLVVAAVMLLMRLFRSKNGGPQPAFAGSYGAGQTPEIGSRIEPQGQPAAFQTEPLGGTGSASYDVPADFDVQSFLRHAKTYFIRLQAAWDKADINDIREFTTPEMFGELRLQLQERGASPNHTDVVSLEAELLGIENNPNDYLASVRFNGLIKESENEAPHPFTEIWNLTKPRSGAGGWVLAGIQQLS
jgi:predicted lipid-binding transport protein (Tim44 family)